MQRKLHFNRQVLFSFLLFLCSAVGSMAQTPVPLASQPGATYTENFADIANWTNGFASGIGASRFQGVGVSGSATIPSANRTTVSSLVFASGASGGVQRGSGNIQLLSTGGTDNTTSVAFDFFVDLTGVSSSSLSFDAALVINGTASNRVSTLRVYGSTDGLNFVEVSTPFSVTNTGTSAASLSISLPASFNNNPNAQLRFYCHNGTGGSSGNRPKISIDNLTISGTAVATPYLAANRSSLTGLYSLTYLEGSGPASRTISLSGGNLTPTAGTITATVSTTAFSVLPAANYTSSSLAAAPFAVSLVAGLPTGSYSASITFEGGGATTVVPVSGTVIGPQLAANPTSFASLTTLQGTPSAERSYTLTAANLVNSITLTASTNLEISSTSGSGFSSSLTFPSTTTSTVVYLRMASTTPVGTFNGTITNTSTSLTTNVTVSGSASGTIVSATSPNIVISQLYGGGGNSGATLINDFVELFNRSAAPVDLTGWGLQYASSTGTTWTSNTLTGSIAPGGYFLVQLAAGAGGTQNLPAPVSVTGTLTLGGTSGKVALTRTSVLLSGGCPAGDIEDFVGYGTGTNCYEGAGPTIAPSNTTSLFRANNGCTDTNQNSVDFTAASPNPRNAASPTNPCSPILLANPAALTGVSGPSYVLGNGPASTTLSLSGNSLTATSGTITATVSSTAFTVTPLTAPFSASSLSPTSFTVTLVAGLTANTYSASVTFSGGGATAIVPVTGVVIDPTAPLITVNPTAITGLTTTQGTASAERTYTLATANLANDVLVSAAGGFEISITSGGGFSTSLTVPSAVTSTVVYVRIPGSANVGVISGTITQSSGSLTATVPVSGTVNPNPNTIIPIAVARGFVSQTVTIQGRVTSTTYVGGRTFYIQDATGGIAIYSPNAITDYATQVQLGDLVTVTGPVTIFSGMTELGNVFSFSIDASAGRSVPAPPLVPLSQLANYQGQLVQVDNTTVGNTNPGNVATTYFNGSTNYSITQSATIAILRINATSELPGAGKPSGPTNITGIVDRFVSGVTTSGTNGIQLQPRLLVDVQGATTPVDQICGGTGTTGLTTAQTFDITTWNVEFFGADGGSITCPTGNTNRPYDDLGPFDEARQARNVKTILERLNSDIFVVEEVSDATLLAQVVSTSIGGYTLQCSDKTSYYWQADCDQPEPLFLPGVLAQKVCVIYRNSAVTPVQSIGLLADQYGYGPIGPASSGTNNWSSGRLPFLFVADVTLNGVSRRLHIVGLHAKSGSAADDYTRRRQDYIDLKVRLDAAYPNANILILGDMNDQALTSIRSGSASSFNNFVTDATNYSVLTASLEQQGCQTFESGSFIDHIFISNEVFPAYIPNSTNVQVPFIGVEGGYSSNTTSDHRPVSARFDLALMAPTSPTATLATAPTTVCAGSPVNFTANVGEFGASYSYTLSNGTNSASATAQTSASFVTSVTATVGGAFTLTVTGALGGSTAVASSSITVKPTPARPTYTLTNNGTVCAGQSLTAAVNGCSTGTVSFTVNPPTNSGLAIPTPPAAYVFDGTTAPGTYTICAICTENDCSSPMALTTVTIATLPTNVSLTSATITCASPSVTLTATGGTSYTLSDAQSNTTGSFTVNTPGTYTVIVANASGCTATATATVGINTATPTNVSLISATITCASPTVTLTATGGASYTLSDVQSNTTGNFAVSVGGNYTVTVAGVNGCTASATATVTSETAVPTPTLAASNSINCTVTSATLTATGGTSYTLSNAQSNTTGSFTVTTGGTYTVTVANAAGCKAMTFVTVASSITAPVVSLSASGAISCTQTTASLTATGGTSYTLSDGQNNSTNGVFSVTVGGSYTVRVTGANGCTNTATTSVVSDTAAPNATLTASSLALCPSPGPGSSATLTATGGINYAFSGPGLSQTSATPTATVSQTGTFSVVVTGANGCTATRSVAIIENASGVIIGSTPGTVNACTGSPLAIPVNVSGTVIEYQWLKGGSPIPGQKTNTLSIPSVQPGDAGTYSLSVVGQCGSATSSTFTVVVNPTPTITLVFPGGTLINPTTIPTIQLPIPGQVQVIISGGSLYEWRQVIDRLNGYEIRQTETNTSGIFNVTKPGPYRITANPGSACSRTVEGVITN